METWQRNQYVMVATVFVVFTGFAFVLPFLTLYVKELGVRDEDTAASWAGVLIGIAPLLAGLLAPVWGRLADRYGHKPMAVRALASYVVLLFVSGLVKNVWQLLALRAGVGLFGGIGPLGLAMASSSAPRDQTGRAVGLVQAAQILSAAVGPLAGGQLADAVGIRTTFMVTAGLCALALLLVLLYYKEAPRAAAEGDPAARVSFGEILGVPLIVPLLGILFLVNFIGRSFTPILPLHLRDLGVPVPRLASSTGLLIAVYSMAAALSSAWLGRATQLYPPRGLLMASLAGGALTVLPMALVSSFAAILLFALLVGLASGGCLTLCYTMGGLMVPADRRATAFGFFSGAALFGGAISPPVAGLLAHWDLRGIYYVDTALFAALTAAVLFQIPAGAGVVPSRGAAPGPSAAG